MLEKENDMEMAQKVGIVVPTYDRCTEITNCLAAVRRSVAIYNERQPAEVTVVVVDDGYKAGYVDAYNGADIYCWQANDGYRLATARNVGARMAIGRGVNALIFLDDDLVPNEAWFGAMMDGINDSSSSVVLGSVDGNHVTLKESESREWLKATGGNMGVSIDLWNKVGEFDDVYDGNWGVEDTDWVYRAVKAGATIKQVNADVLHQKHEPHQNWIQEQALNWGKFAAKFNDVGRRPIPRRMDSMAWFSDKESVSSEIFIVTATRDRPKAVKSWGSERLTWGVSMVIANDSPSGTPLVIRSLPAESANACLLNLSTGGVGTSQASRMAIDKAIQMGAKYVVELDDHDTLRNGMADISQIYELLERGADYVYGNYTLMHHDGRSKPVITSDYEPGILMAKGMQWLGFKAYSLDAYKDVGGYVDAEFPAGDYSLALRFEIAGKNIQKAGDVWTVCTVEGEGDEGSLMMTQRSEARRKVIEYKEKYKNLIQNT